MDRETRTIEQFCCFLERKDGVCTRIVSRPDRENPGKGGCDAIIRHGGTQVALEHTTIDSYKGQRLDSARINKVIGPLRERMAARFPNDRIRIAIRVHSIPTGIDWKALQRRIATTLEEAIPGLPRDHKQRELELDDVPFPVYVSRGRPATKPACFIVVAVSNEREEQLKGGMIRVIAEKGTQLAPYKGQGMPTIAIVEFDDIQLVNEMMLAEAFHRAAEDVVPVSIDDVYLADTTIGEATFYPVKLGGRLYPNLPEFERAQCGWTE